LGWIGLGWVVGVGMGGGVREVSCKSSAIKAVCVWEGGDVCVRACVCACVRMCV